MISVVIPTWNAREIIHLPLASLRRQTHDDFEIIVVDDASTDGTGDHVREHWPEVRLVRLDVNKGFPGAVNAGIFAARGHAIALLNNDAEADEGWLSAMAAALESSPRVGMVACRIRVYHHRHLLDSAGIFVTSFGSCGNLGAFTPDGPPYDRAMRMIGPNGAAGLYRRALFEDVGVLDETLVAYYEDTDIALRAQLRGWACVYAPDAVCYHVGSVTNAALDAPTLDRHSAAIAIDDARAPQPAKTSPRVMYYAARNYPIMLMKFVPLSMLLADCWAIAGFELNMLAFAIRNRLFRSFVRGRLALLPALPDALRKRFTLAASRRISAREVRALFRRPSARELFGIVLRRLRGGERPVG
ncbi:MAG: glycosyltransferase family 2 protein [Proteobacteria bacterium]|nr:glycosyltransferase family 2 protein [Pseudomonadota bacterium]